MTTITTAVRNSAAATRHSFRQAFVNTGRSVAASAHKVSETTGTITAANATKTVASVGKSFAQGIAFNLVLLEGLDVAFDLRDSRRRRREIAQLTDDVLQLGLTPEISERLALLHRAPERRTFGQFVRDIPSRMVRRLWRATLVEAGWWFSVFTAPLWVPVSVAYAAYAWLVVFPTSVASQTVFGYDIDMERWLRWPSQVSRFVLKHTLYQGVELFARGITLKVHNRSAYCDTTSFVHLDGAKFKAHQDVATIIDGRTAFAWGEQMAEVVSAEELDNDTKQRAYAQFTHWADENIAGQFQAAVKHGFRTGTPFLFRDLVIV